MRSFHVRTVVIADVHIHWGIINSHDFFHLSISSDPIRNLVKRYASWLPVAAQIAINKSGKQTVQVRMAGQIGCPVGDNSEKKAVVVQKFHELLSVGDQLGLYGNTNRGTTLFLSFLHTSNNSSVTDGSYLRHKLEWGHTGTFRQRRTTHACVVRQYFYNQSYGFSVARPSCP